MASIGSEGSRGGKRNLNAEINLVPFIDLLSMCICFLLMTAVWIQIGSMQVKQSHGTDAPSDGVYDLQVEFKGPNSVAMFLNKNGKSFKKAVLEAADFSALTTSIDQNVKKWLETIAPAKGKESGAQVTTAMIRPAPGVPYGSMVAAMDVLRKNQIMNLGVVPVGSN